MSMDALRGALMQEQEIQGRIKRELDASQDDAAISLQWGLALGESQAWVAELESAAALQATLN